MRVTSPVPEGGGSKTFGADTRIRGTMLTPLIMKLEHFRPLSDHDKEWLNGLVLRYHEFPAHSDIIREEELHAGVFVVVAGHACCYKILPDGSRQPLDFMFPGDKTELYSRLLKATDHGISTLGPTTIAWINPDRLIVEVTEHPHVASPCGGMRFSERPFYASALPRSAAATPTRASRICFAKCSSV